MSGLTYRLVRPALVESDLAAVAPYMFWLMFRNVASDGLVFEDPKRSGVLSRPGCVLASPSWDNSETQVSQDYVYHWTRGRGDRGPRTGSRAASRQPAAE